RLAPPSSQHWLGVDGLGRDVFSRVLYGGRVSLPVALVVVITASLFGSLYGALAAYLGGWFDEVAMRIVDMVLCFPVPASRDGNRSRTGPEHPELDARTADGVVATVRPALARAGTGTQGARLRFSRACPRASGDTCLDTSCDAQRSGTLVGSHGHG